MDGVIMFGRAAYQAANACALDSSRSRRSRSSVLHDSVIDSCSFLSCRIGEADESPLLGDVGPSYRIDSARREKPADVIGELERA